MASTTHRTGSKVATLTGGTGAYGATIRGGLVMNTEPDKDKLPEQVSGYVRSTVVMVVNAHVRFRWHQLLTTKSLGE